VARLRVRPWIVVPRGGRRPADEDAYEASPLGYPWVAGQGRRAAASRVERGPGTRARPRGAGVAVVGYDGGALDQDEQLPSE